MNAFHHSRSIGTWTAIEMNRELLNENSTVVPVGELKEVFNRTQNYVIVLVNDNALGGFDVIPNNSRHGP